MIKEAYAAIDLGTEYDFGHITSLGQGIGLLVGPAFSIATAAVVIYFLMAAFKLVTSGADKEALESAKNMMTHAVIGFVILMLSFIIFQFVFESFGIGFSIF